MTLVIVMFTLFAFALASYLYGTYKLAQFAFRLGSGKGWLVALCPPYTLYFALFELREEGQEFPTSAFAFGGVLTILAALVFSQPLGLVFSGQMDKLTQKEMSEKMEEGVDKTKEEKMKEKKEKMGEEDDESSDDGDEEDSSDDEESDDENDDSDEDSDDSENEEDESSEEDNGENTDEESEE